MSRQILQTERLLLREFIMDDFISLSNILKDPDVMYAYEHDFDDNDVYEWLSRQIQRYQNDGFGLWAVELKESGEVIGQCGLTWQEAADKQVIEVGYLFQKAYWHKGYATEAAIACKEYAFNKLNADEVFSIVKWNNTASQNVAKRNGMTECGRFIKQYKGKEMPHIIYSTKR